MRKGKYKLQAAGRRVAHVLVSAALAAGCCMPAAPALAQLPEGQTGSGETELRIQLEHPGEYGGTGAYATGEHENPDVTPLPDGDGLGDNLMFSVPTAINYIAKPDGSMVGTSSYIENESAYQARVSSLQVVPNTAAGWAVESDAMSSSTANVVDFVIGPAANQLAGADYLAKAAPTLPDAWNMSYATLSGDTDKVALATTGHMNNVAKNIAAAGDKFASVQWYVSPGNAIAGTLTIASTFEHGTVVVRDASGAATSTPYVGDVVTLDCTPEAGYGLASVTVTDGAGNPVAVTYDGDVATFTMPESATVTVAFGEVLTQAGLTSDGTLILAKTARTLAQGQPLDGKVISKVFANPEEWTGGAPSWAADAASVTKVTISEPLTMQTCAYMFAGMVNLAEIEGLANLNTAAVTDFSHMFDGCASLTSLDLSGMNTYLAQDMTGMFDGMSSLESVQLGEQFAFGGNFIGDEQKQACLPTPPTEGRFNGTWVYDYDPSYQYTPTGLRDYCYAMSTAGTVVRGTIWEARQPFALYGNAGDGTRDVLVLFTEADGASAQTLKSKVNLTATVTVDDVEYTGRLMGGENYRYETAGEVWSNYAENACEVRIADRIVPANMDGWFANMDSLANIVGLENIDTSECTSMANLFAGCESLASLDLSGFDTSKVEDMSGMFAGCSSLASIHVTGGFDAPSMTDSEDMFAGCTSLVGGAGTPYDASHVDAEYARIDAPGTPGYFTAAP